MKKEIQPEYIIDPTLDEIDKYWEEYYSISFYCSNCHKPTGLYDGEINVLILKGKAVKDIGVLVCPNCKNLSLTI